MLDDGIYALRYRGEHEGEADDGNALAILRNGRILGSDRWGGVFAGHYEPERTQTTGNVRVRLEVPPEGMLVNGIAAGSDGAIFDIIGTVSRPAATLSTIVEVAGRPIEIELKYLAPLPG